MPLLPVASATLELLVFLPAALAALPLLLLLWHFFPCLCVQLSYFPNDENQK
jgi:hypothetical protein